MQAHMEYVLKGLSKMVKTRGSGPETRNATEKKLASKTGQTVNKHIKTVKTTPKKKVKRHPENVKKSVNKKGLPKDIGKTTMSPSHVSCKEDDISSRVTRRSLFKTSQEDMKAQKESPLKNTIKNMEVISDLSRVCPVPGCDSSGHLSGKYDQHLTAATCPLFHNLTPQDCIDRYNRRNKRRIDNLYKAVEDGKKSPKKSPPSKKLPDRKASPVKTPVKSSPKAKQLDGKLGLLSDQRKKDMAVVLSATGSTPRRQAAHLRSIFNGQTGREPDLKSLTPIFDYELFREAQCKAAELFQKQIEDCFAEKNTLSNKSHTMSPSNHLLSSVVLGKYDMDIWYSSPYPDEYLSLPKLYICEFCLKYFNSPLIMQRHVLKCLYRYPPGDEIYRRNNISFFEVDGDKNKTYCQNLCLLAKLFLHHKTLYYDVEPFRFYIMTEADDEGFHLIGYFSKEKNSFLNYNVSCILTLPPYQKQGYGRMLIDFSYLLSKKEGKIGSPEKPLSDLGLISYRSYWKSVILEYLLDYKGSNISIRDLSHETAINAYDIVSTLQALSMLKYWKGKHVVLKKKQVLDEFKNKLAKIKKSGMYNKRKIDPTSLHWNPIQTDSRFMS